MEERITQQGPIRLTTDRVIFETRKSGYRIYKAILLNELQGAELKYRSKPGYLIMSTLLAIFSAFTFSLPSIMNDFDYETLFHIGALLQILLSLLYIVGYFDSRKTTVYFYSGGVWIKHKISQWSEDWLAFLDTVLKQALITQNKQNKTDFPLQSIDENHGFMGDIETNS